MNRGNKIRLFIIFLSMTALLLTGCGLYGPEETMEIDPPPVTLDLGGDPDITLDVANINPEQNVAENTFEQDVKKGSFTIYFFDANDDVVPLTLDIPKVEGIGKQVLKYMTIGGPAEGILPAGFRPVIPEGTTLTMTVKLEQKLAIIDFSKEFLTYEAKSPAEEKKILDAITWSMTEFPTIEQVELRVNGYQLDVMPVWQTPIVGPLSRMDGVNLELANNINIGQTTLVTLYFSRATQDHEYLVPVTRLIPKTENVAKATLEQLIIGPKAGSNLVSSLLPTTKILNVEVSDKLLVADFDDEILGYNSQLSDQLINMIVWSLSENTAVPTIQLKIKGDTKLLPEMLSKPIFRPEKINAKIL